MNPLRYDHLEGKRRRFYTVRLIALCAAVSVLISAGVGALVVVVLRADADSKLYQQDIATCERANATRRESNARIPSHALDRDNLAELARRLAHTRTLEARTWARIAHGFHIERQVDPIVLVLRTAHDFDTAIVASERHVTFRPLRIYDCHDQTVVKHP